MIGRFFGKYRFLSNFYPSLLKYRNGSFPSVENAFQAMKTLDLEARKAFMDPAMTPNKAKGAGRKVTLRPDWESVKLDIMDHLVNKKFHDHPELAKLLLATGNQELVEGNNWNDTFWGVCQGRGENHLGLILMRVRNKLRGR